MNGVHDMGGMHGMGPIEYEKGEPVFHARWEAIAFALNRAMGVWGKWNLDASRHGIERLPPAEYLRMSYYEKWTARLELLLVESGLITRDELGNGKAAPGSPRATPALMAAQVPALGKGRPASRDVPVAPRFRVGQDVRARNMHPAGHTRLPRYARGRQGIIDRDHGVFVFPDTNAQFLGEKPQHVYSVRFTARELWGERASPRDSVFVDLWDDYLEPAEMPAGR
ncbi:MAG: nitrile hydratase subunit beta [Terriglobia bacterium]|nr:MAG: nitrile hydratase subunit beta [Terriglobia bacterium]